MTGLSEADVQLVSSTASRLIDHFPDGLPRTITLRKWDWEIYDRLQRNKGWKADVLAKAAYQVSAEFCHQRDEFETNLRWSFAYFLSLNAGYCMEMASANNNGA